MKYAAVVLRNAKNSALSADFPAVTDEFLSGGVFLDEIVLLPYDAPSLLSSALLRLSAEYDGVFLVCDKVLLPSAREALGYTAERPFVKEYLLETENCLYAALPAGKEGAEIVKTETVPAVDRRRGCRFSRMYVCTVGAPAEKLKKAIERAEEAARGKLELHASEKFGCARVEIIYHSETPKMTADEVLRILATDLEEYVYALDDVSVAQRLFDCLKLHRMRLSTAESFTAGGIGRAIVEIPGASSVFFEGLNTYDGKSKEERLGVSAFTLKSKGAVSSDVAYEMAAGLLASGNCDLAIATTGVAGPKPDGPSPVGLCYIAVGTKEKVRVFRFHLEGNREKITSTAVNLALFLAYKEIK